MAKTAEEIYNKYRTNLSNATEYVKSGVKNTTKSQTANAIAQKERMVENHRKAIDNGTWEANLRKAGDEKWRNNMLNLGVSKMIAGVDANETEIKAKFAQVAEVGSMVQTEVSKLPKGGTENAVARVRKTIELTKKAWGKE